MNDNASFVMPAKAGIHDWAGVVTRAEAGLWAPASTPAFAGVTK